MFLFLSKFLSLFIYPMGLIFVLGWVIYFRDRRAYNVDKLAVLLLLILWLGGNGWSAQALGRSLEWRFLPQEETPSAPVMVVLGGGTEPWLYPRTFIEVNGAGDRLIHAARLYQAGAAQTVVVSGGGINWMDQREMSIAEEMRDLLMLMGVPQEVIVLQDRSANTYEDALYCAEFLLEAGIDEIILVTSASHMPRSVALFEKQGFTVIAAPTDFKVTQASWDAVFKPKSVEAVLFALVPSADNLGMVTSLIKEYLGSYIYSLRGWM